MTSVFEFEGAELIDCRYLPIIPCGDYFVDMNVAEFSSWHQNLGTFLGNKLLNEWIKLKIIIK